MPAITRRGLGSLLLVGCALALPAAGLAAAQTGPTTTVPAPATTTQTVPPTTAPAPAAPPTAAPTTVPTTTPTTVSAPKASSGPDVQPFVECSFLDTGTGKHNTVWGYTASRDRTIPVGPNNRFDNPSQSAGQPKKFRAGVQRNVFVVTHNGASTWTLLGAPVTAPVADKTCSTNPVPIAASSWAGLVTIAAVTLLLGTALWWRSRRRARRL